MGESDIPVGPQGPSERRAAAVEREAGSRGPGQPTRPAGEVLRRLQVGRRELDAQRAAVAALREELRRREEAERRLAGLVRHSLAHQARRVAAVRAELDEQWRFLRASDRARI